MKKPLSMILSLVLMSIVVLSFVGCSDNKKDGLPRSNNLPDFEDCEIGYKLEVYPKVAFDYELPDGTIVHIDSIEATLTAKNEIKEGDVIKDYFYPYEFGLTITGSTTSLHQGKKLWFIVSNQHGGYTACDIVDENGSFTATEGEYKIYLLYNVPLYFRTCYIG